VGRWGRAGERGEGTGRR